MGSLDLAKPVKAFGSLPMDSLGEDELRRIEMLKHETGLSACYASGCLVLLVYEDVTKLHEAAEAYKQPHRRDHMLELFSRLFNRPIENFKVTTPGGAGLTN